MSDVRLTATNPEDSSVVPVACNAKGELKLEEPIEYSFDGSLDGDLSVTGSATFEGDVYSGGDPNDGGADGVRLNHLGTVYAARTTDANSIWTGYTVGITTPTSTITAGGSATFAGNIRVNNSSGDAQAYLQNDGSLNAAWGKLSSGLATYISGGNGKHYIGWDGTLGSTKILFDPADGTATFAGGKAGFTADGYLWCTTRRGDTVILDATSNGLGTWADFTPPTRAEQAKERIDALKQQRDESDNSHRDEAVTP